LRDWGDFFPNLFWRKNMKKRKIELNCPHIKKAENVYIYELSEKPKVELNLFSYCNLELSTKILSQLVLEHFMIDPSLDWLWEEVNNLKEKLNKKCH